MISVYRMYFGRSWEASGMADELVELFDGLPKFLYSGRTQLGVGFGVDLSLADVREAVVKIAMTQCHVALVWGGTADPAADWTSNEIRVARSLLRRSIPVLGVVPKGYEKSAALAQVSDRTVGWSAVEIARAAVELAEAAAESRHLGRDGPGAPPSAVDHHGGRRPLPMADIVVAYHYLRSSREDGTTSATAM